jgi:muconolactone delta-isomerase
MKKLTSIAFILLFASISSFAQESVEQRKINEAQKKLEEAKADHYKKLSEARKEMEGARLESIRAEEKARKEAEQGKVNLDRSIWRGNGITGPRYMTYVQGSQKKLFDADNFKEVTYSIPFATGTLELNFAPDSIIAYDGKEIVLKSWVEKEEQDLVEGLVLVNGDGVADNSGMGLQVEKKESADILSISELDMRGVTGVKMMVPQSVKIVLKYNSTYQNEKITLINLKNELDVAVRFNPIAIKNVTGPATINTMYGKIEAVFEAEPTKPVSLISSYGDVSVNMPSTSKVDLNLKTTWGKIYVPQSLVGKLKKDADSKESKEQLKGSINGGGNLFVLASSWGKIFLRLK